MSCVTERSPASAASPRPRRIAPPRWLDLRFVLGIALVLASVLLGARIVSAARDTSPAFAARHDLAAGTILSADDLSEVAVQLPDTGERAYLDRLEDAVGKRLSRPVAAGELVPVRALANVQPQTTVTVPLAAGAAPDLRKGERIELWVSTGGCEATVLLSDVTVQSVRTDAGSFGTGSGGQDVVISVAPPLADRVVDALALENVELRAGVLTGSSAGTGPAALPDLRACAESAR